MVNPMTITPATVSIRTPDGWVDVGGITGRIDFHLDPAPPGSPTRAVTATGRLTILATGGLTAYLAGVRAQREARIRYHHRRSHTSRRRTR